jgi:hypothetical protein
MLIELDPQHYDSLLSRVTEESPLSTILKKAVKIHRNTVCSGDSDIIAIVATAPKHIWFFKPLNRSLAKLLTPSQGDSNYSPQRRF